VFCSIRHYGILSSKLKVTALPAIRNQLQHHEQHGEVQSDLPTVAQPIEVTCPCCKKGIMQHVLDFDFRGLPPAYVLKVLLKNDTNPMKSKTAV
jgi:hypothetical protein